MSEDVRALKDALEKPKHTKEHINENSNRYFVENFRKLWAWAKIYALNFTVRGFGVLDTINK